MRMSSFLMAVQINCACVNGEDAALQFLLRSSFSVSSSGSGSGTGKLFEITPPQWAVLNSPSDMKMMIRERFGALAADCWYSASEPGSTFRHLGESMYQPQAMPIWPAVVP